MSRLLGRLESLPPDRVVAATGALLVLLVVAGWSLAVVNGSARGGQVLAAVAALLIGAAGLLYAFRLGTSPASE